MNIYWSISKKLVVIWVLVGTLFLIAIAGSTFFITSKALEENVQFQVKELAPFLNSALTTPLLQKDYATAISIAKELAGSKSIYELVVFDINNNIIARSDSTLSSIKLKDSDLIGAEIPLRAGDLKLGFVKLKLSKEKILETENNILAATIYIGIIAIVIFIFVAILLGRYITNPIVKLAKFSKNYNNYKSIPDLGQSNRSDEIGDLYIAYESMLLKIQKQIKEVDQYAFYDSLTKLANRRLVMDRLEQAHNLSVRNKLSYAVLLIDIDHFKVINDSKGHPFGDQILVTFAERILSVLQNTDTASRLGGDEFLVLISNPKTSPLAAFEAVRLIAEKLHKKLSEPYHIGSTVCSINLSIGITLYSDKSGSVGDLLKEADLALYEAKKTGRNSVRFFSQGIHDEFTTRINTVSILSNGIKNSHFRVHYQSQVDQFGKLVGFEALLRWSDDGEKVSLPSSFIPTAEDCGLIIPIGSWMLLQACSQLALWRGGNNDHLKISVNISTRQFLEPNFLSLLQDTLSSTNAKPENLKLEITESLFLLNADGMIEKLESIKNLGVTLCIDDFGTGYSSLNYLKRLPIDEIKIDKSFVDLICTDVGDLSIVSAIIYLSKKFNLRVIAEGVESPQQLQVLIELGCNFFQGYYFHKPSSFEDLISSYPTYLLDENKSLV